MFDVMRRQCKTCIYRRSWQGTPITELERQVADRHMGFKGHRICHSQKRGGKACCRGFWNRHRDAFAAGQIAQRLDMVRFVEPVEEAEGAARRGRKQNDDSVRCTFRCTREKTQ